MKKILSVILAVTMIISICAMPALAQETAAMTQIMTKDIITIKVDGTYVDCSVYGQLPVIVEGRTLVPLRSVFEALGATVEWNNDERSVTSVKGDVAISLAVDSVEMVVNGQVKTLDVPAQIMNERTMVPVRAVAEAFGCEVSWDNDTRTVVITTSLHEADAPATVVKKVLDDFMAFNFEGAAEGFVNKDDAFENQFGGVKDIESLLTLASGMELTQTQLVIVEKFISDVMGMISYEIGECIISGDVATVEVTMTAPDFEGMDANSYANNEEVQMIVIKALSDNGYEIEDIAFLTDEAELEKIQNIMIEAAFDYVIETLNKAAKDAPVMTETTIVTLNKINGRWLIVE